MITSMVKHKKKKKDCQTLKTSANHHTTELYEFNDLQSLKKKIPYIFKVNIFLH